MKHPEWSIYFQGHFMEHGLPAELKEIWEERAAILEFDAGLERWVANLEAWKIIKKEMGYQLPDGGGAS